MLSAQLATQTHFCAAQFCAFDADPGSDLCTLHIRLVGAGVPVVLHHTQQPTVPDPETHLWCPNCPEGGAWHPDDHFNRKNHGTRRGRHSECRQCSSARRKRQRIEAGAEGRAQENARARTNRARRRARINGQVPSA